jgi:hypothetical protein
MKRRVICYLFSVASVYLTMNYLTQLFMNMISNFTFSVM